MLQKVLLLKILQCFLDYIDHFIDSGYFDFLKGIYNITHLNHQNIHEISKMRILEPKNASFEESKKALGKNQK